MITVPHVHYCREKDRVEERFLLRLEFSLKVLQFHALVLFCLGVGCCGPLVSTIGLFLSGNKKGHRPVTPSFENEQGSTPTMLEEQRKPEAEILGREGRVCDCLYN